MSWSVNADTDSPVTSSDLEGILAVLPKSVTADLGNVNLEPELSATRLRLAGLDGRGFIGLGGSKDARHHLTMSVPHADDGYERLKFGARFSPMFLKVLFLRKKQVWPSAAILDIWQSLEDAGWQSPHQDQSAALADLLSQAFILPMDTPTEDEWQIALANRLVARGLENRKIGQVSRSIMDLVRGVEPEYDLPEAAYRLSTLRRSLISRLAQSAVRQVLKSQVHDAYRRARLLHAIFAEPASEDHASDMLPDHLTKLLRSLTQKGEAYGLAAIPLLSETLMAL